MKNKLYFSENPQNKRKMYVHVCNILMENSLLRNVDYQFIFCADTLTVKPRLNCIYIEKPNYFKIRNYYSLLLDTCIVSNFS